MICPDNIGNWYVMRCRGSSFVDYGAWITGKYGSWDGASNRIRNTDVDGDGKADIVIGPDNTQGNEGKLVCHATKSRHPRSSHFHFQWLGRGDHRYL